MAWTIHIFEDEIFARFNELNTHFGWEFEQCPPPRGNIHVRDKNCIKNVQTSTQKVEAK